MFGLAAQGQIIAITDAILAGDAQTVLRELEGLAKHGKDLSRLLADLLGHFRNLLIHQVGGGAGILELGEAEAAAIQRQSPLISVDALTRIMEVLTDAEGRLRDAASKKIFVEVALLRTIEARNAISIDTLLKQLQAIRSGGSPPPSASRPAQQPPVAAAAAPNPPVSRAIPVSAETAVPPASVPTAPAVDLQPLWQQLLEAVGRASTFTRSYLSDAHPLSFEKNVLTIGFDPEFADQMELVNNAKTHALLQGKLQELGHANAQARFIKADRPLPRANAPQIVPPPPAAAPSPKPEPAESVAPASKKERPAGPLNLEDFKNDPLIQKALELFKGQIVDVRT
jgi:DNA polymerase-3 subunit gamma/tau